MMTQCRTRTIKTKQSLTINSHSVEVFLSVLPVSLNNLLWNIYDIKDSRKTDTVSLVSTSRFKKYNLPRGREAPGSSAPGGDAESQLWSRVSLVHTEHVFSPSRGTGHEPVCVLSLGVGDTPLCVLSGTPAPPLPLGLGFVSFPSKRSSSAGALCQGAVCHFHTFVPRHSHCVCPSLLDCGCLGGRFMDSFISNQ